MQVQQAPTMLVWLTLVQAAVQLPLEVLPSGFRPTVGSTETVVPVLLKAR